MRVLIVGAGAVGSLLGARLATAGHQVLLVSRGDHLTAVQTRPLKVTGNLPVTLRMEAVESIPRSDNPELALLTAKAYDVDALSVEIGRCLTPTMVIALENGLGILERVTEGLRSAGWVEPYRWAAAGINTIPATLVSPGEVRQAGEGEILLPDARSSPKPPEGMERVVRAFTEAGVACRRVEDFTREVWRKVLVNAAINPVTADHRVLNGQLLEDPWRGQALRLLTEARSVAASEGVNFTLEEAESDLWRVVRATASNRSSMLQDLDRRRPTEIDAISGELARRGQRHGLAMTETLRAIRRIERRTARPRSPGQTS